jgi:6-phosphogluconolactonase (cycloisomerase 2 family)
VHTTSTTKPGRKSTWHKVAAGTAVASVLALVAFVFGGTNAAQAANITVPAQATVGGFAGGQQVSADNGLIYLPGNQDHVIRVYSAPLTAGAQPVRTITAAHGLQYPLGVHVHNGLLYVTNDGAYEGGAQGSGWISVYTAGGAGTPNTELRRISGVDRPHDIATDDHYMYVSSFRNSHILTFPLDAEGRATPVRTITGSVSYPTGLTTNAGSIYTANKAANTISVHVAGHDGANTPTKVISGSLSAPTSVAVANDHVFAINSGNNTVTAHRVSDGLGATPQWVLSGSPGISAGHGIEVSGRSMYVSEWAGSAAKNLHAYPLPINPEPVRLVGTDAGAPQLAFDMTTPGDGFIYLSDPGADRVLVYTDGPTGSSQPVRIITHPNMVDPYGLAVDVDAGLLYVTNYMSGQSIQVFQSGGNGTPNDEIRRISTSTADACSINPNNIAIYGSELFVTSHGSDKICVFRAGGAEQLDNTALRSIAGGQIDGPLGITVHNDEVYVASQVNSRVLVFPTTLDSNTPARTITGMTNLTEALAIGEFNGFFGLFVGSGQTTNTISAYPLTANGVTSPEMIITGEDRADIAWARGIDIHDGFLYVANTNAPKGVRVFAPEPTLSSVVPNSARPGSTVTLTGAGFSGTSEVRFAGTTAAFTLVSDSELTVTVPMIPAGAATVEVVTGSGVAAVSAAFTSQLPAADDSICLSDPTLDGCPAAPSAVTGVGIDGGVALSFTAGSDGGDPLTNYAYSIDDGPWTATSPAQTSSPVTIDGLTNNQNYSIRLRAVSSTAAGPSSPAINVTAGGPNLGSGGSMPTVRTASASTINSVLGEEAKVAVNQFTGDTVRVVIDTTSGSLTLGNTAGLDAPSGYPESFTGSEIAFTGTRDAVNTALDTLTFTSDITAGSATVNISAAAEFAGKAFNPDNGHYYEFVNGNLTWNSARDAAKARTFNGLTGYLANVTSAEENSFITSKTGGSAAWIGGSDLGIEGVWTWMDGPEAGQVFWTSACGVAAVGQCGATGAFNSWSTGEPNNSGDEDALQILAGGTGRWNDLNRGTPTLPMIVEYSELDGSAPVGLSASRTLTIPVRMATVADDACVATPTLVNGDFEDYVPPTWSSGSSGWVVVPQSTPGIGWRNTAIYNGLPDGIELQKDTRYGSASGRQHGELNAYVNGTFYQELPTTPGQTLRWRLAHGSTGQGVVNTMRVMIGPNLNSLVQSGANITSNQAAWQYHTGLYTVPEGQTTTVFAFQGVTPSESVGNLIDDISFATYGCSEAPKGVAVAGGNGFATVSFTPADNGGHAITNYAYSIDGGPWTELATPDTVSPITIDGLQLGRDYSVAVRPLTPAGVGRPASSTVRMPTVDDQAAITSWTTLTVASDGTLYAAPRDGSSILVFAPGADGDAAPVRTISGPATGLSGKPHGLAVTNDGTLFATSYYTDEILVFAPNANGNVAPVRTITSSALDGPHGIAYDAATNTVWVSSQLAPAILSFPADSDGATSPSKTIAGPSTGLTNPRTVALGAGSSIYVSDDTVRVYSRTAPGNNRPPTRVLPSGGNTGIDAPAGLATDPVTGTVYVASMRNNSIRAFTANANGNIRPLRILRGPDTGLQNPTSLAVHTDLAGNTRLYATSPGNNSIRGFTVPPDRR